MPGVFNDILHAVALLGRPMHHLIRANEIKLSPGCPGNSKSYSRCSLSGRSTGAVHAGVGLCALGAGGILNRHVHSYEEIFYVLEGTPTLVLDGRGYPLRAGACGVVPVGMTHAWIGADEGSTRWLEVVAPPAREGSAGDDTFFIGPVHNYERGELDIRDPRSRHFFRFDEREIVLDNLKTGAKIEAPTVSASMATALLAYSGIALKMLVDQRLDAALATLFMVEYQPGGAAHLHDHPLEEAYFMLEGELEAVADDKKYVLHPGDLLWTGVGCIHAFFNTSGRMVRFLETQSPQPPYRHSYRFNRDWDYLKEKLGKAAR
jgi:quercetin dioxygenase-like cupin family protein